MVIGLLHLNKNMNNHKQFGVWMDSHKAIIVGNEDRAEGDFKVLAHVKAETNSANSNEKNANNHEKTLQSKFFKEIASHIVNATNVHITGTGQVQEQFLKFLADTPQFKNTSTAESTANEMSDEKLLELMKEKF
jgi:stalled ribosome rescue protein Dom34